MSEFDIDVRVMLPVHEYKRLHAAATKHKTTVGALVAELVRRGLQPGGAPATPKRRKGKATAETRQRMLDLYRDGLVDAEIARQVGMSTAWVFEERKFHGLPANGRKPLTEPRGPYR
jgi:hypothetical protein